MTTSRADQVSHTARAQSFNAVAAQYADHRPTYPPALFDAIEELTGRPLAGSRVADVGAGTGVATARLLERDAHVVAVEPGEGMAAEFRRRLPGTPVVRGDGDALPLAAHSADLITYAQSWHWTDPARSVPEALRVLRPAAPSPCGGTPAPSTSPGSRRRPPGPAATSDGTSPASRTTSTPPPPTPPAGWTSHAAPSAGAAASRSTRTWPTSAAIRSSSSRAPTAPPPTSPRSAATSSTSSRTGSSRRPTSSSSSSLPRRPRLDAPAPPGGVFIT